MQRRADASQRSAGQKIQRLRSGSRLLLVAAAFETEVRSLGLLEPGGVERWLAQAAGPEGRTRTAVIPLEGRSERLHLRPVHHGGLLGGLLRDWVLGVRRPAAELAVAGRLRALGAPVSRPVLVVARRRAGPIWNAAVGTVYEENSVDGEAFLRRAPDRERLLRACAAAGRALRRFHDVGGRHRDLHVKNLLVREESTQTEALIVDLDRARLGSAPRAGQRMSEIMRLYRSLVKRDLAARVGADGFETFLGAYTGGDDALREALLRFLPRERRRLALHRLAWRRDAAQPSGS